MPDDKFEAEKEDEVVLALESSGVHFGPDPDPDPAVTDGGGGGGGTVTVVDGSGTVVGTATFNPETGALERHEVETTVVEESSAGPSGISAGGPEAGPAAPPGGGGSVPGGGPAPAPTAGMVPLGVLPPEAFRFKKTSQNEQTSNCVPIVFRAGTPFGPVEIRVGVVVKAPLKLRDGKPLTEREAQLDSSSAATATAEVMAEALNAGTANSTEVMANFSKSMDGIMRAHGIGYRVLRCTVSID